MHINIQNTSCFWRGVTEFIENSNLLCSTFALSRPRETKQYI